MVNIGMVGLGHNGLAHLRVHCSNGHSRVVHLCDRNEERLAIAAELAPGARLSTNDEIYDDPEVDAVSINTGDAFHCEPFIRALKAGKHVFIEKPVANSIEEIRQMFDAWRRGRPDQVVAVGYVLRWNPVFAAVKAHCAAGRLGRVYYLEADYIHNLLYQRNQTDSRTGRNWYLEEEQPIVGGGSHPLDLLRWFTGRETVEVSAYGNHCAFPEMTNEDCQVALFRFEDGTIAKVAALYGPIRGMAEAYNLRVYGTKGTVERDRIARAKTPEDVHPDFEPLVDTKVVGHPYDGEILDWLEAIENGKQPRTPFWDGANSTLATLTAVSALRAGASRRIPRITADRKWLD